ncbi:ABC transporter ATP-binding protein [Parasphaerochaeta coccoides]|uniref:Xenobiotic-transporting ATPase n=1 Tax=Parasphaerochaeta coccoides (strain ATCC BAA-1237 / DSM 17374 / SPN1) TaxID=760011 RepID=F4GIV6_PARC1|nr:ABC transporter ATP-binding protein [Parasphaerochaeta coccoides]AEC02724.1 Xenobiotic-transporting ATPase [Parasphaerochaeta coccoides DSM 17374]
MVRKLFASIREYKKPGLMAPLYVIIESILEILIPTLMALLIDNGIAKSNMNEVLRVGIVLVVFSLFALFFGVRAGTNAAVAASGFARNLRKDMFYNVQTFSFSNIDKFSTSSIITRLTTDVTNVQMAYQMVIRLAVRSPFMIIFAMIFSFRIDSSMSMIFLGAIPVLGIGLWFIMSSVHPIFAKVFGYYDLLNSAVEENLHGMRVVKSYNREKFEEKKFTGISQLIFQGFTRAGKRLSFVAPLMQICLYTSMLLLSWFGAKEIIASGNNAAIGLSTGELASMITYAMQILMSLMMLSMVVVMITISRASIERIAALLSENSDLTNPENPVCEVPDGSVVFDHVTFSYSRTADKPVLDDVSVAIAAGQVVGIIGGTGSSKSSFVQLIPRLYDVISGSVRVGGVDVRDYEVDVLRNQVAMVLQKNVLFSGTIKENLRWGNENATDDEMRHAAQLAQADEFISGFPDGYDTYIEQGGSNVSGGQRQRLCIARALLKNPKVLILDDSTSAVDMATDSKIREAMRTHIPGTTKIIIAQRVASVQDADMIIVLDDGRISAVGTHEQLLESSSIYCEVYHSQTKGSILHE